MKPLGRIARQHGVVLLIVLWMLTLITIIAMSYSTAIRTEMAMFSAARSSAEARAGAEAGIWKGVSKLMMSDPESRWRGDGTIYPWEFQGSAVRISIQDQGGLIDLNKASQELLSAVITNVLPETDTPEELVDQIIDWRDSDSKTERYGAEDQDYRVAELDYTAKDGPFSSVDELQQLLSYTPEIYAAVAPLLTVYSGKPAVNIKTAPQAVIAVLPEMSETQMEQILTARDEGDFKAALTSLSSAQRPLLVNARSTIYEIRAETEVARSIVTVGALVLIAPMGRRPYTVLSWNDPGQPLAAADPDEPAAQAPDL